MLDELISFTPIGLPMGDLFWGLFSSIVMYLAPACIALAVLALAGRRQARAGKVIAFPAARRPARPAEARKEGKKRAA